MSTTTAPTNEELAAMVTALAARAETAEQNLARIAEREARELALLSEPAAASKPRSQFANVQAERQAHARLARLQGREAEAEAQRKQAEKDAPKQAKRDKEISAINEQIDAARSEIAEQERKRDRLIADVQRLKRLPL